MKAATRPGAVIGAGLVLVPAFVLVIVVFSLGPAWAVVAITAALVLACVAACVAVGVWEERSGQRMLERARAFGRSRRRESGPAPRRKNRR